MTENDDVKPYRAREVSTGQEAADAVRAVMQHAEERDKAAKKKSGPGKQPKWLIPVGLNLGVLAAYLLFASPDWVQLNPILAPPVEQQVEFVGNSMWDVINAIEVYRQAEGGLPASLDLMDVAEASRYTYVRSGGEYVLIALVGERQIRYDTSQWESPHDWSQSVGLTMTTRIGG